MRIQADSRSVAAFEEIRYDLGFTAASLRPELARIIAEAYLAAGDWGLAKNHVLSRNEIQSKSRSSLVRMERELRQRLQRLSLPQVELLARATSDDRAAMAWLAALKQSRFIYEFAAEVLRDKLVAHDPVLRPSDYETFVVNKSAIHPELTQLASASRKKIRQVLLRMLAEAGLLVDDSAMGRIQRPILSPSATRVIVNDSGQWLAGFLFPDSEIRSI
jgi:hypothetical protein